MLTISKPIKYKFFNGDLYARSGIKEEWKKIYVSCKASVFTPITQRFGENAVSYYSQLNMKGHNGIDWKAPSGTTLYSPIDGIIEYVQHDKNDGYGGYIIIVSDETENDGKKCKVLFIEGHLMDEYVKVGQIVKRGEKIGLTDNTGKYTNAPHLHEGMIILYQEGKHEHWLVNSWYYNKDNGYGGYTNHEQFIDNRDVYSTDKWEGKFLLRKSLNGEFYKVKDGNLYFLDSEKNQVTRHIPLVDEIIIKMNEGIPKNSLVVINDEKDIKYFEELIIK